MAGIVLSDDGVKMCSEINEEAINTILDRYKKYQIQHIDTETENNINFMRDTSDLAKIYKKLKEQSKKELMKLYPDIDYSLIESLIYISYDNDAKMRKDIDKIIEDRDEAIEEINNRITDVKALINLADSYYEKMEILKNYGIVDSEGKIKSW